MLLSSNVCVVFLTSTGHLGCSEEHKNSIGMQADDRIVLFIDVQWRAIKLNIGLYFKSFIFFSSWK